MDEDEWDDSDDEGKARYEDVDWKHLLPDVKAAATELGYTQEMWDSESSGKKKLAIEDKDWDELSQKERDLLKILGYNEDLVRINMNAAIRCFGLLCCVVVCVGRFGAIWSQQYLYNAIYIYIFSSPLNSFPQPPHLNELIQQWDD